jgi:hypothetical protein
MTRNSGAAMNAALNAAERMLWDTEQATSHDLAAAVLRAYLDELDPIRFVIPAQREEGDFTIRRAGTVAAVIKAIRP